MGSGSEMEENEDVCPPCDFVDEDDDLAVDTDEPPTKRKMCAFEGCHRLKKGNTKWCKNHKGGVERSCQGGDVGEPQCPYPINDAASLLCFRHTRSKSCAVASCENFTCSKSVKYCSLHNALNARDIDPETFDLEYEEVRRIKRDRQLRAKHFDTLYVIQGGKCRASLMQCYEVVDGKPISRCPWNGRVVEPDMLQLDHKTPLFLGGDDDDPDNFQLICACCHQAKSAAEQRARAAPAVAA